MNSRNLFGTVVCAILGLAASSAAALGRNDPADDCSLAGNGKDSPPPFSETMAEQSQSAGCCDVNCCQPDCCPRWTSAADFIIMDRIGGADRTLVETVPRSVKFPDLFTTPGTEVLNSNDLQQGFCGGPRLGLIRHDDSGYDLELSYFQIHGWLGDRTVEPGDPAAWLVMRAPGLWLATTVPGGLPGWIQTNQYSLRERVWEGMAWQYGSELDNAEFNVRWKPCSRVTVLAGFRWVNLQEDLVGALDPPTVGSEPPFWNTTTTNNLYGFQIGADGKIVERGRFSMDALLKAGIFDDYAEETTQVSVIHKTVYQASASTNHAAFVGKTALQCKYQVAKGLSLIAGYEVIWLEGVALAPGQIQETYTITRYPITHPYGSVQALGVNCNSGAFYQGATVGLEYSF